MTDVTLICSFPLEVFYNNTYISPHIACMSETEEGKRIKAPLPWIGVYAAAASLLCFLAIAADAFLAFRGKKLWFPCKFFALNAAWLTLLAVAMKMPLDITTPMPSGADQLAKLSSTALLSVVIGNFMPSLGAVDDREILTNIIALAIFVITVVVNVCVQLATKLIDPTFMIQHVVLVACMFFQLLILTCSSLTVPTIKKYLEMKYSELQRDIATEESEQITKATEKLKGYVKKYWIMAETGSPQFSIARSVTCSASGAICFLINLVIVLSYIQTGADSAFFSSDYKYSTFFILAIQSVTVVGGSIGPAFRWFTVVKFSHCSKKSIRTYITELKPESYWTERLVDWRERPLFFQIRGRKYKKLVQGTKGVFVDLCIKVQIIVVVASKLIIIISILMVSPSLFCHHYCIKLMKLLQEFATSNNHTSSASASDTNLDPRLYVLSLEGEAELPGKTLKNICNAADGLILKGKKKQAKNLTELLGKSTDFQTVSQNFQELCCCRALSVVTLTSIAVAILGNKKSKMAEQLIQSVSEGLSYVRLVEENMDDQGSVTSVRNAADKVWFGVELYRKWLDQDLHKISVKGTSPKERLEILAHNSENIVKEFKGAMETELEENLSTMETELEENPSTMETELEENPSNWPIKLIAANSMYRINRMILLDYEDNSEQAEDQLFEKLSKMVGGMLSTCLTNLPNVIIKKCALTSIEKIGENIRFAIQLLGETEEIQKILQGHEEHSLV